MGMGPSALYSRGVQPNRGAWVSIGRLGTESVRISDRTVCYLLTAGLEDPYAEID